MIPIKDMTAEKSFSDLKVPGIAVDHTDIMYNAGHPGVEMPHIHIVLWHIPAEFRLERLPGIQGFFYLMSLFQ